MPKHVIKINANPLVRSWLVHPNRKLLLHGWRKGGPRGQVKRWQCREQLVLLRGNALLVQDCGFTEG